MSEAPPSLEQKSQKSCSVGSTDFISFVANKELLRSLKWSFVPRSEQAMFSSSLNPALGARGEH